MIVACFSLLVTSENMKIKTEPVEKNAALEDVGHIWKQRSRVLVMS